MSFNLATLENDFLYRMGGTAWSDLNWVAQPELYAAFDEAAKRLAQDSRAFVDWDATTAIAANVSQYATPAGWISSSSLSLSNSRLRPSSVDELLALDATWQTTPCVQDEMPSRYSHDAGPLGTVTLYKLPQSWQAGETLVQVYHRFPADLSPTQTAVPVPAPVADYFSYFAAARARGKQSEAAMPEMAEHFEERVKLYEQVIARYWGES